MADDGAPTLGFGRLATRCWTTDSEKWFATSPLAKGDKFKSVNKNHSHCKKGLLEAPVPGPGSISELCFYDARIEYRDDVCSW